jgi:hypothetical protein
MGVIMEVPIPSLENVKVVWEWTLQQLSFWFEILRDPVSALKEVDLDSSESTIKAIQFAAFPMVLGPALMTPVALLVDDTKSALSVVGYFAINVILNVVGVAIATVGQRFGAKLVRGKGSLNACAISTLYGTAFWPIFVLTVYVGANFHSALHPDPKNPDPPGVVPVFIVLIVALSTGFYVLRKYVPMTMYVHEVGRFRAWLICSITVLVSVILMSIASSSFMKPLGI